MANNREEHEEFTLEDILAEFGTEGTAGDAPVPPSTTPKMEPRPAQEKTREDTIRFPILPEHNAQPQAREERAAPEPKPARTWKKRAAPDKPPGAEGKRVAAEEEGNLVPFPEEPPPPNFIVRTLDRLKNWGEAQAEHMYEEEGSERDEDVLRAEQYIPGVDVEEEDEEAPHRERRARRALPEAPDLPPAELARRYGKGLSAMRLRGWVVFLLFLPLLYLALLPSLGLALPAPLVESPELMVYLMAGLLALSMILAGDVLLRGLFRIFQLRLGLDTILSFACVVTLLDTLTMETLDRLAGQPFCAPCVLGLAAALWGTWHKRRGMRVACRTAASAREPYLVTRDEGKWNGRGTYMKWSGVPAGFGRQIQGEDGAQRIFSRVGPIFFIACVLFSIMVSVGRERAQDILWALSGMLTVTAGFSATLCFGLPWDALCARLAGLGAALAGWDAAADSAGRNSVVITDGDLFPPGMVTLNGIKVFGDFSVTRVVGVTATLIRDSGSGLDQLFHDLLRSQGSIYRKAEHLERHEAGGLMADVRGERIFVGSSDFMNLMEVPLPPGLKVKNAVFCAIDGELAAIFALNYRLHGAVEPTLYSLIQNRLIPVLATRDFNVVPIMLKQRFKLPVEKMEFPSVERRQELSETEQEHAVTLSAVLCRVRMAPYADALCAAP
ncbi:MAG: hypothetical protein LIO58_07565, partial [Oscillospiraceae bacterium]|nr:hypothetical protein [Oscillospiraceae bacterium]